MEVACRTDGSGRVSEHSVFELKTLDVGYGYTADDGKSFPLRGKGIGLMPTLAEVLQKYPHQRFLVQIKDGARQSTAQCFIDYLETGWFGRVPRICDDGIIIVAVTQTNFLWGWPNRFLARMRAHRTEVMLIGRLDSVANGQFSRLDTLQELSRVPAGFDGSIWTDRVGVIGPAVHR